MSALPPFELTRPQSRAEACGVLSGLGYDGAAYSGGTELVLLMKLGLAEPAHLVDVKRIPELRRLDAEDGILTIGAAVTHREIERSELVRQGWPGLADMESQVANIRVRTAGTLGGNLAFADPHSDPATFLLAAGAEIVIGGAAGERRLPAGEFLLGAYQTALEDGELITAVRVPRPRLGGVFVHRKMAFRERPAVTVTVGVGAEHGEVDYSRIAVGSVGLVPQLMEGAASQLIGGPSEAKLAAAGDVAAAACQPVEDVNGSQEYKRQLVRVLVRRAAEEAITRARAGAS